MALLLGWWIMLIQPEVFAECGFVTSEYSMQWPFKWWSFQFCWGVPEFKKTYFVVIRENTWNLHALTPWFRLNKSHGDWTSFWPWLGHDRSFAGFGSSVRTFGRPFVDLNAQLSASEARPQWPIGTMFGKMSEPSFREYPLVMTNIAIENGYL